MKYLIIILLILSCSKNENKVRVIKQWHLSPSQITLDINKSKDLLQFENQKDIYQQIVKLIDRGETDLIIAEGCEGEIDESFSLVYNGWDLKKLKTLVGKDYFVDIMAPIPLKIKAKYPRLKVVCGDNLNLIQKNLSAISDLRGFSGFYQRLRQSKGTDDRKYRAYEKQLNSLFPNNKIKNPIQFTLEKSLSALKEFEGFIKKRNEGFFNISRKKLSSNPIIVIGGLHVQDLQARYHIKGIKAEVIVPNGYKNDEQKLIFALKTILQGDLNPPLIFFQVPNKFDIELFPIKTRMKTSHLMSIFEKNDLKKKTKDLLDFDLLLSDYDNDGIRDFTLSTSGTSLILSAEDTDWDNDGIENIVDDSVGSQNIGELNQKIKVSNNFLTKSPMKDVLQEIQKKVKIIQEDDTQHELLILEVLTKVLSFIPDGKGDLEYIVATTPKFKYGENVFFSYVKHTKVMEYYPEKLNLFINKQFQKRFRGVKFDVFIQSYVIPLIIHSLSHEVAHSLRINPFKLAKKHGWKWDLAEYKGKYLISSRHPKKIINEFRKNVKYKNKSFKDWMIEYSQFSKAVNKIIRIKNKTEQQKRALESPYYIDLGGNLLEHKLSFLHKNKIPSVYSLKNPNEWFAEAYATCVFKRIFPKSRTNLRSVELEHLLGMSPGSTDQNFCDLFN